jgi:hypothetical protein
VSNNRQFRHSLPKNNFIPVVKKSFSFQQIMNQANFNPAIKQFSQGFDASMAVKVTSCHIKNCTRFSMEIKAMHDRLRVEKPLRSKRQ